VYFPVAHWVWGGGWLSSLGIEYFAGGTVVHVNAGSAGLALAIVLGKRRGWGKDPMRPHNLPLVLLGAGLLWFGWFGFNAGSELAADGTAALALINTQIATAAAAGGWILAERFRDGKPTTLGVASGAVAGLVAITPACAFIDPWAAILLGLAAGVVCCYAIGLKHRLGFDDSLDVVGVHLVGGALGAVSLGFLAAYPLLDGQRKGLFYGGGVAQLGVQALGPVAVGLYSFAIAWILGTIIDKTMGFRVSAEDEETGVDVTQHAETAYDFGSIHLGHLGHPTSPAVNGAGVTGAGQDEAGREAEPATGAH
jgi:Amt family ammonium transporter